MKFAVKCLLADAIDAVGSDAHRYRVYIPLDDVTGIYEDLDDRFDETPFLPCPERLSGGHKSGMKPKLPQVRQRHTLFSNPFFTYQQDDIELPSGQTYPYYFLR